MANFLERATSALTFIKGARDMMGGGRAADTTLNINRMIGAMEAKNGLARPNLFLVEIGIPEWATDKSDMIKTLPFFCETVNMPGLNLIPVEMQRQGFGLFDRRVGSAIQSGTIDCTFMVDGQGDIMSFFQNWMNSIVNIDTSKANAVGANGGVFGTIAYRDTYICDIKITMYDQRANKMITWTGRECWPFVLGDLTLSWNDNDNLARLNVSFQYRSWDTESFEIPEGKNGADGILTRLIRLGTAGISMKASARKPRNVGDVINIVRNTKTFAGAIGGVFKGG